MLRTHSMAWTEPLFVFFGLLACQGQGDESAGYDLELFQKMTADLLATGLGKFMSVPYSYIAMTKRSIYVDKHVHAGQEGRRVKLHPGEFKFLFIYPFLKTRAWYLLSQEERQKMMDEHIRIGHKYPTVRLNTTFSTDRRHHPFGPVHRRARQ